MYVGSIDLSSPLHLSPPIIFFTQPLLFLFLFLHLPPTPNLSFFSSPSSSPLLHQTVFPEAVFSSSIYQLCKRQSKEQDKMKERHQGEIEYVEEDHSPLSLIPGLFPTVWNESGNEAKMYHSQSWLFCERRVC